MCNLSGTVGRSRHTKTVKNDTSRYIQNTLENRGIKCVIGKVKRIHYMPDKQQTILIKCGQMHQFNLHSGNFSLYFNLHWGNFSLYFKFSALGLHQEKK